MGLRIVLLPKLGFKEEKIWLRTTGKRIHMSFETDGKYDEKYDGKYDGKCDASTAFL